MNKHPSNNKKSLRDTDGPVSVPMNRKSSTTAIFKVILLGDSLVGKSSIVMRLVVSLKPI